MTSTRVLTELMMMPEQNIPTWLLERAHAVAVIPSVIKVGLGIGGRRGKGVLVVRKENGEWSNPVFVNLTGGSFGFQVGVQSTDVVLVFTSRQEHRGHRGWQSHARRGCLRGGRPRRPAELRGNGRRTHRTGVFIFAGHGPVRRRGARRLGDDDR